jgi:hypothetical protein
VFGKRLIGLKTPVRRKKIEAQNGLIGLTTVIGASYVCSP